MLRHHVAIARPQQAHRKGAQVRHEDETTAVRPEQAGGFRKDFARLHEMFDDRPERHRIETGGAEIVFHEVRPQHRHTLSLRVVQRRADHVCAQPLVSARPAS